MLGARCIAPRHPIIVVQRLAKPALTVLVPGDASAGTCYRFSKLKFWVVVWFGRTVTAFSWAPNVAVQVSIV